MLICSITGNIICDNLVKVEDSRFLQYRLNFSFLQLQNSYLTLYKYPISHFQRKFLSTSFSMKNVVFYMERM